MRIRARQIRALGGTRELRSCHQRVDCGLAAGRLLRCRDAWRVDLVRHPRHRQHRPSGLHHPRLLHRLYPQHPARHRSDHCQHRDDAGVLSAGRGGLSGLLSGIRETRTGIAARPVLLLRALVRHRGDADPRFRRRLPLRRGLVYRPELAPRGDGLPAAHAGAIPRGAAHVRRVAAVPVAHLHRPRDLGGGAGPAGTAPDGGRPNPHQAHRLRHLDRHHSRRRRALDHHPAGRAVGRT